MTYIAAPTVRSLRLRLYAGDLTLATATGFVVDHGGRSFLVTNHHVVTGQNVLTGDDAVLGDRGVHFHDLRHTGNHLAAITGASTKELMARMGHSSVRAAMIYQHATRERDHEIARAMRVHVEPDAPETADQATEGHAGGTNGPSSPGEPAA